MPRDVVAFPIYGNGERVVDVMTVKLDGKMGYSSKSGELRGDALEVALHMAKELIRHEGHRVIELTIIQQTFEGGYQLQ